MNPPAAFAAAAVASAAAASAQLFACSLSTPPPLPPIGACHQHLPRHVLGSSSRPTAAAGVRSALQQRGFFCSNGALGRSPQAQLTPSRLFGYGRRAFFGDALPTRAAAVPRPLGDGGFSVQASLKSFSEALELLLTSVIVIPLFKKIKVSPVLGFIAAGIILGPHGENWLHDYRDINEFAEFGVLFLLFEMGLELSVSRLKKLGSAVFGLGTAQVTVTTLAIAALAKLFGGDSVSYVEALVIGNALSLSSSAFVLQLLRERGELGGDFGQASFAVLLLQDIAVVPLLVVLPLLGTADLSHPLLVIASLGVPALKAFGALGAVIAAGHFGLGRVFQAVSSSKSQDAFIAAILLTVLGMGYLTEFIGLSDTLGAFLAGVLLSETQFRYQIEADISPARGLLLALFFMTVGFNVDLQFAMENAPIVAALILWLASITSALAATAGGLRPGPAVRTGLLLSQGGEFSFVIFALAKQLGILPEDVNNLLIVVVALSMALTPVLAAAGAAASKALEQYGQEATGTAPAPIKAAEDAIVICGSVRC
eukprot:tig00020553_g10760.t1